MRCKVKKEKLWKGLADGTKKFVKSQERCNCKFVYNFGNAKEKSLKCNPV